jgi:hypothetical protein
MAAPVKDLRWNIFHELLPYNGKLVTQEFIQKIKPVIPVIKRINPIMQGSVY